MARRRMGRKARAGAVAEQHSFSELKSLAFSVRDQTITVHGDPIVRSEETERASIKGTGRNSGRRDPVERCYRRSNRTMWHGSRTDEAQQKLLAATPAWHDADAGLDEADRQFRMGLDGIAMQQDFTTAAEGEARCCAHDWEGRVFEALERTMPMIDEAADYLASALSSFENDPQIRTGTEVLGSLPITRALKSCRHATALPIASSTPRGEGVHLGAEFQARDAIPEIREVCPFGGGDGRCGKARSDKAMTLHRGLRAA